MAMGKQWTASILFCGKDTTPTTASSGRKRSQGYHGDTNLTQMGRKADRVLIAVEGVSRRGSLDHLVRLEEKARRNREAEGLGSLEVDDQLELHRLLHGEVPRVSPLQDLVHIGSGTSVIRWTAQPIEQEG